MHNSKNAADGLHRVCFRRRYREVLHGQWSCLNELFVYASPRIAFVVGTAGCGRLALTSSLDLADTHSYVHQTSCL